MKRRLWILGFVMACGLLAHAAFQIVGRYLAAQ